MNSFSFSKAFWICERCKAPLTLFTVQQAIWRVVGSLCNHDWHCYTSAYNYDEALFAKVRLYISVVFSWDTVGLHILVLGIFLFWQTCLIFKVSDRSPKKLILFICSWKRYRWTESTFGDYLSWVSGIAYIWGYQTMWKTTWHNKYTFQYIQIYIYTKFLWTAHIL